MMTRTVVVWTFVLSVVLSAGIVLAYDTQSNVDYVKQMLEKRRGAGATRAPVAQPARPTPVRREVGQAAPSAPPPTATAATQPPRNDGKVAIPGTVYAEAPKVQRAPSSGKTGEPMHHFSELTAYAGYYHGFRDSVDGWWAMAEYTKWMAPWKEPKNFGLGLTLMGGSGSGQFGSGDDHRHGDDDRDRDRRKASWRSFSVGPNLDYYQALTPKDDLLIRIRPMYRFAELSLEDGDDDDNSGKGSKKDGDDNKGRGNKNDRKTVTTKRQGVALGGYVQYSRAINGRNRLILAADGHYFPRDSFLSFSLLDEYWVNKDWKLKYGLTVPINFGDGSNVANFGPHLSAKYRNFVLGVNVSLLHGGFIGPFAGYELNTDLQVVRGNAAAGKVKTTSAGQTVPMPTEEQVTLQSQGNGTYSTMPGARIELSGQSIDDEMAAQATTSQEVAR